MSQPEPLSPEERGHLREALARVMGPLRGTLQPAPTPRDAEGFHSAHPRIGPEPPKEREARRCRAVMQPPKRHGGSGAYFDPGNGTCWPCPDFGDPTHDLVEVPDFLVNSIANAYGTLLTHPCGVEMLARCRRAWKKIGGRRAQAEGLAPAEERLARAREALAAYDEDPPVFWGQSAEDPALVAWVERQEKALAALRAAVEAL